MFHSDRAWELARPCPPPYLRGNISKECVPHFLVEILVVAETERFEPSQTTKTSRFLLQFLPGQRMSFQKNFALPQLSRA
jgi:hypothetical protein